MRKIILHNIIMERKKRVYNIILNSVDTKSYTGQKWNANYFVDFANIMDAEALKSSYLVRFRLRGTPMNAGAYNASNLVVLNLGFSSCSLTMSNNANSRTVGVLSFFVDGTHYIDTKPDENLPMYIDNISSTSVINFNLFNAASLQTFQPTSLTYVCILTFEEQ